MNAPETVTRFMAAARPALLDGYRTHDRAAAESCTNVARRLARLMLGAGLRPSVVEITPAPATRLRPAPLAAHGTEWDAHRVCVAGGVAFDPIAARPLPLEEYAREVFGPGCAFETVVPEGEIADFVRARESETAPGREAPDPRVLGVEHLLLLTARARARGVVWAPVVATGGPA